MLAAGFQLILPALGRAASPLGCLRRARKASYLSCSGNSPKIPRHCGAIMHFTRMTKQSPDPRNRGPSSPKNIYIYIYIIYGKYDVRAQAGTHVWSVRVCMCRRIHTVICVVLRAGLYVRHFIHPKLLCMAPPSF